MDGEAGWWTTSGNTGLPPLARVMGVGRQQQQDMFLMVMSSAYVVSFTGACGVGVSDVYMLKSVGDSTPPCGTPFLNWRCVDVLFLNVVYALRALM